MMDDGMGGDGVTWGVVIEGVLIWDGGGGGGIVIRRRDAEVLDGY